MSVLRNEDNTVLLIDCCDGCGEGIRFQINKEDFDYYCFMTYTNGHWYREQDDSLWRVFCKKIKKIWAIIRNKDFYYSEVIMKKNDFDKFKEYINSI